MWTDLVKQHIQNEIAYSPEMKAHLVGLVDSTPADDPEAFLSGLIGKVNASPFRSRELCKWLGRVLYQFKIEGKDLPAPERLVLLENLILGRR